MKTKFSLITPNKNKAHYSKSKYSTQRIKELRSMIPKEESVFDILPTFRIESREKIRVTRLKTQRLIKQLIGSLQATHTEFEIHTKRSEILDKKKIEQVNRDFMWKRFLVFLAAICDAVQIRDVTSLYQQQTTKDIFEFNTSSSSSSSKTTMFSEQKIRKVMSSKRVKDWIQSSSPRTSVRAAVLSLKLNNNSSSDQEKRRHVLLSSRSELFEYMSRRTKKKQLNKKSNVRFELDTLVTSLCIRHGLVEYAMSSSLLKWKQELNCVDPFVYVYQGSSYEIATVRDLVSSPSKRLFSRHLSLIEDEYREIKEAVLLNLLRTSHGINQDEVDAKQLLRSFDQKNVDEDFFVMPFKTSNYLILCRPRHRNGVDLEHEKVATTSSCCRWIGCWNQGHESSRGGLCSTHWELWNISQSNKKKLSSFILPPSSSFDDGSSCPKLQGLVSELHSGDVARVLEKFYRRVVGSGSSARTKTSTRTSSGSK